MALQIRTLNRAFYIAFFFSDLAASTSEVVNISLYEIKRKSDLAMNVQSLPHVRFSTALKAIPGEAAHSVTVIYGRTSTKLFNLIESLNFISKTFDLTDYLQRPLILRTLNDIPCVSAITRVGCDKIAKSVYNPHNSA